MSGVSLALVSGANRGIGLEVARSLARDGYRVLAGTRSLDAMGDVGGLDITPVELDVTDPESIARIPFEPLEVLVNNAGIYPGGRAARMDFELAERAWQTNALGAWRLAVAAIPHMGRGGRIVNVSSQAGSLGTMPDDAGMPAYNVSKTALNAITRLLAVELRERGDPRQLGLPGLGADRHGRRVGLALGRGGGGERAVGGAAGAGRPDRRVLPRRRAGALVSSTMDDPYAILGVKPGVPADELAAAYRSQAKRWHPDRNAGEESVRRMAQVNAAYDLLRAGGESPAPPRAPAKGVSNAVRRALGAELLEALEPGEEVRLVTPTSTWSSARAVLVVTDRRLLWLLDDVVTARVQWLRFSRVASIRSQLRRPRRRVAVLRVEADDGRRFAFAELRPPTADAIIRQVRQARSSGSARRSGTPPT